VRRKRVQRRHKAAVCKLDRLGFKTPERVGPFHLTQLDCSRRISVHKRLDTTLADSYASLAEGLGQEFGVLLDSCCVPAVFFLFGE